MPRHLIVDVQERVNILDFIEAEEWEGILAGTSTFDCTAALEEAIDIVSQNPTGVTTQLAGPRIYFPPGKYYFANTIQLKKTVILEGDAVGEAGNYASTLRFASDTTAFIVHRFNTIDDTVESPTTTGGDATIFRNLRITGGGTDLNTHGIWLRARATLEQVSIEGFAGNGVNIVATVGAGGSGEGNANCWSADTVRVRNCHIGWYVDGDDANAGRAVGLDVSGCESMGVCDSSLLGNTYVGCHTSGNGELSQCSYGGNRYYVAPGMAATASTQTPGTGSAWVLIGAGDDTSPFRPWVSGMTWYEGFAYYSDSLSARNVFVGCYSESSQPPSHIMLQSNVLGGLHGAGFTTTSTAPRYLGESITGSQIFASGDVDVSFNRTAAPEEGVRLITAGDHASGYCPWFYDTGTGTIRERHARTSTRDASGVTLDTNTLTFGRAAAPDGGQKFFPAGFFVGSAANDARHMTNGTGSPVSGDHARGEIVWNRSPSAGGVLGWVCTAAGTPGTWFPFGAIRGANAYTTSNVTTDRSFDANATTTDELADVLGTLIADLKVAGVLA